VLISIFRKQIAEQVIKMLPYTILSSFDHLASVQRSAQEEVLQKCFDEDQQKKVYERAAPKTIKLCLELIQKKHALVTEQK
jgi:hypothetical protein